MNDTGFKYTYFNNMFIPIVLTILVLTFIFIIIVVPYDLTAYPANVVNAVNSVTSFIKG
jgi:hypothetical protein